MAKFEGTPELPIKANVANVILKKVVDGRTPEHYLWKKTLEKEWAGKWGTVEKLTKHRYRIGLDPAFVEEQPQFRRGQLHWFEWVLCENGGIIHLYDEDAKTFSLWTTTQTAQRVLAEVKEANLTLETDDRLTKEIRFPLPAIYKVCELAGARKKRQYSDEQKAAMGKRIKDYQFLKGRPAVKYSKNVQG